MTNTFVILLQKHFNFVCIPQTNCRDWRVSHFNFFVFPEGIEIANSLMAQPDLKRGTNKKQTNQIVNKQITFFSKLKSEDLDFILIFPFFRQLLNYDLERF